MALVMWAYCIGVIVGEETHDHLYGISAQTAPTSAQPIPDKPALKQSRKWQLYSGLFVLLKHKLPLSLSRIRRILRRALALFVALLNYPVRILV